MFVAQVPIIFIETLLLHTLPWPKAGKSPCWRYYIVLGNRFDVLLEKTRFGATGIWIMQMYCLKYLLWKRYLFFQRQLSETVHDVLGLNWKDLNTEYFDWGTCIIFWAVPRIWHCFGWKIYIYIFYLSVYFYTTKLHTTICHFFKYCSED